MVAQGPLLWPTVKLVRDRVKNEGEDKVYQGAVLNNYTPETLKTCAAHALADIKWLEEKMRARLEWSDVKMLRAILVLLDTQSWQSSPEGEHSNTDEEEDDLTEIREAVEYITLHFREAKCVDLANVQDELEEIIPYARKYLSIGQEGYQKVWYKLHTAPDASKWSNILHLCELLFSLPFSSGHVERMFSMMKIIKMNKRTNLKSSTLSDLLDIKAEGAPLAGFSADKAVALWWDACKTTRRVSQAPRKEYRSREQGQSLRASAEIVEAPESDSSDTVTLEDWDDWFGPGTTTTAVVEQGRDADLDS